MNRLDSALLAAAKRVRQRLRAEATALRDAETKMIAEAVREKAALPDHYWQARRDAEERARTAARMVEALRC